MGQPPIPPTPAGTSLAGKTAIITGGNCGLGHETVRQYIALGASRVIITVRSKSKGEAAISALRADTSIQQANTLGTIEYFELELDDYESVLAFTQKVKSEVNDLDILLLNGGRTDSKYETSASGHERIMQVNAYSNLLIALELLPLLRATAQRRGSPSHLAIVGSYYHNAHTLSKTPIRGSAIQHFDDREVFPGGRRYADSKLAVIALARQLASRIQASEVIINVPCPGFMATNVDRNLFLYVKAFMALYKKTSARKVEEGARTLVFATCVAGQETHGEHLQHNQVHPVAPFLHEPAGKDFGEKLWSEILTDFAKHGAVIQGP